MLRAIAYGAAAYLAAQLGLGYLGMFAAICIAHVLCDGIYGRQEKLL